MSMMRSMSPRSAWVYAYLRGGALRDTTAFPEWLRRVTLSQCADYRRRRGTRRLGESIDLLTEQGEKARYVEQLSVRSAIAGLGEAHQTTLLLHYVGGWSVAQTADLLGISVNTVRSRLASIR